MQHRLRLRRPADFARVRQVGRVQRHAWFTLSYAPNNLPHNRYGIITAKRIGKAVVRNRVRRLLRESLRHLHTRLSPGFDVIVIARQPLVGQPITAVQRVLSEVLHRAGLVAPLPPDA